VKIDFGGYSSIVSDRTAINKMLNKSKANNVVAKSSKRPYAVYGRMAINVGRNSKSRFYQEMVNSLIIEREK
jgi:hypothetical protein